MLSGMILTDNSPASVSQILGLQAFTYHPFEGRVPYDYFKIISKYGFKLRLLISPVAEC